MNETAQLRAGLLTALDEAFDRKAWHGATLWGTLRGVAEAEAAWRPAPGRHNVWELSLHCAYWKYVVRRRLTGGPRRGFPIAGRDWFTRPSGGDGWKTDLAILRREHEQLRSVVAGLSAADLARLPGDRDPVREIRGVAAHDVYHTGQIRLLLSLRKEG